MRGRPWSPDDTSTLRRMACAGYSDAEIAAHIHRDRDVIGRKRRDMGICPGISPALTAMMARINARRLLLTSACRS